MASKDLRSLLEKLGARRNREVRRTSGPNSKEAREIGKRYRHLKRLANRRCSHDWTDWFFCYSSGTFVLEYRKCLKCRRTQNRVQRL